MSTVATEVITPEGSFEKKYMVLFLVFTAVGEKENAS